jgi:hypothetical protein
MACNCKRAAKIIDANSSELSWLQKVLLFLRKIGLFTLAMCSIVVLTPVILIGIFYTLIFKGSDKLTIPTKVFNMIK